MDIKEVRRLVSNIKAQLFKNSNSYSIGMLKSHFRGVGLQFKEHRVYQHGDDVRFIDWRMLAKTDTPYIKTFEEERNVEITVIVDASPTMYMSCDGRTKLQAALELSSLLYLLAAETGDYVHVLIFGEKVIDIKKGSGELGLVTLISQLEKHNLIDERGRINRECQFFKPINSEEKIKQIFKHLYKKREVVIFSDLHFFLEEQHFDRLIFNKNIHCFRLLAPLDMSQKKSFSLWAGGLRNKELRLGQVFSDQSNSSRKMNKKIKDLKIEDRYLEKFIREMI
jgi:uncharacterized protein (DUF58 family)